MKKTLLIILSVMVAAGWTSVQAQLINVQFVDNSVGNAYGGGGPAVEPSQVGGAVLVLSATDMWNTIGSALTPFTYSASPSGGSGGPYSLDYVNGWRSGVTVTIGTFQNSYNTVEPNWGSTSTFTATPVANLMGAYISAKAPTYSPVTVSLAGLAPSANYELVLYSAANAGAGNARTTDFTVNGNMLSSAWDGLTSTLSPGVDYVEYTGATSDALGNLVITFSGVGTAEGDLNGFQLVPVPVPEPSTFALVGAGMALLLGYNRRKALRA
jgi:hypothetical protein